MNRIFPVNFALLIVILLNGCRYHLVETSFENRAAEASLSADASPLRNEKLRMPIMRLTELMEVELIDDQRNGINFVSAEDTESLFRQIVDHGHAHLKVLDMYYKEICEKDDNVILRLADPKSKRSVAEDVSSTPTIDYMWEVDDVKAPTNFVMAVIKEESAK